MRFLLLVIGGIVGAAQVTVFSPLVFDLLEAGWILVTSGIGALLGIAVVVVLMLFKGIQVKVSHCFAAYILAFICGSFASLVAPMLAGIGPDAHKHAYLIFTLQYAFCWGMIWWLLLRYQKDMKDGM